MNKVTLAMITMNAGKGIPGSTIRDTLELNHIHFGKIIVVDGDLTDEAKQFYSLYPNLVVVNSPWHDSYVDQYRAWSNEVDDGSWVLYLDCDESVTPDLISFLHGLEFEELKKTYNTLCLPCILYLSEDGKKYYAAEPKPSIEYTGQWMKNILVKKDDSLDFKHFGSHVIPHHGKEEKGHYIPYAYKHMKTLESFVYNDVWQAYLHPQGQGFNPVDAKMFGLFTKCYSETKDFKRATYNGQWSAPLQKFAWDRRNETGNAVSRLAWVYWVLEGHEMPEEDLFMTWENVQQYVLDKEKLDLMKKNAKEQTERGNP